MTDNFQDHFDYTTADAAARTARARTTADAPHKTTADELRSALTLLVWVHAVTAGAISPALVIFAWRWFL